MKLLHQLGHNLNWAMDAYFENKVGDGFLLCARSIENEKIGKRLGGHEPTDYMPISLLDLQFYGSKESEGKLLKTYDFHPINYRGGETTEISTVDGMLAGIKYQEKLHFKEILIPNILIKTGKKQKTLDLIRGINNKISKKKKEGVEYFLTIPMSSKFVQEDIEVEQLLQELTHMDIAFDGYYVVCEPSLETSRKVSINFNYYINLVKVLFTLKKQGFKTILGFANVDSLVFSALCDIDYVSLGTYENLRNFDIKRFTGATKGGPSDGWYYSEKLLNFVKSQELEILRKRNVMNLIKNEDNIFSDIILQDGFVWNTHKPEVHKNYLLAISRQLKELSKVSLGKDRVDLLFKKIEAAKEVYRKLEEEGVYLGEASSNYHLPTWMTVLKTPISGVVLEKEQVLI